MGVDTAIAATQIGSAITGIMGGAGSMFSANTEAGYTDKQAELIRQEAEFEALQKRRDVARFRAEQAHRYASSGVLLEGSPLMAMERTRRLGQEEIDAILRRGYAQSSLAKIQASQMRNQGRNALYGSLANAGNSALGTYIQGRRYGLFDNPPTSSAPKPLPPYATYNGAM